MSVGPGEGFEGTIMHLEAGVALVNHPSRAKKNTLDLT